jgi:hypothetical protein
MWKESENKISKILGDKITEIYLMLRTWYLAIFVFLASVSYWKHVLMEARLKGEL